MTTATYTDYPFTSNGVGFVSRIHADSPFVATINAMPAGVFEKLNADAVADIIGDASLLTREQILSELARVNEGGTHAFILLDEGNN